MDGAVAGAVGGALAGLTTHAPTDEEAPDYNQYGSDAAAVAAARFEESARAIRASALTPSPLL